MNVKTDLSLQHTFASLSSAGGIPHNHEDLIVLFNATFTDEHNTILVVADHEPIYIPAKNLQQHHQIVFAHGYFASALHEIAHWCIAGQSRRLLEDYGYWYSPDGRNVKQQAEFEKAEVKPQAIEWAFSCASSKPFAVSTDNLEGVAGDTQCFQHAVKQQMMDYLTHGFPPRAAMFISVLQAFYKTDNLYEEMFDV